MMTTDAALFAVVLLGLFAGGFMVARSPTFWFGVGQEIIKSMIPILMKRMPPEKEQEWRDCIRRGGEWDHIRKKCKR
jgi:hypothetical protein